MVTLNTMICKQTLCVSEKIQYNITASHICAKEISSYSAMVRGCCCCTLQYATHSVTFILYINAAQIKHTSNTDTYHMIVVWQTTIYLVRSILLWPTSLVMAPVAIGCDLQLLYRLSTQQMWFIIRNHAHQFLDRCLVATLINMMVMMTQPIMVMMKKAHPSTSNAITNTGKVLEEEGTTQAWPVTSSPGPTLVYALTLNETTVLGGRSVSVCCVVDMLV